MASTKAFRGWKSYNLANKGPSRFQPKLNCNMFVEMSKHEIVQ